jgi:DNA-binding protein HU-beta
MSGTSPALVPRRKDVNKAQLIDALADRLGGRKAANDAVDAVLDTIQRAVAKGERVAITGFGVFEKNDRPARTARNPATGEKVKVKKTSVPKFKPGQGFKDVVSGAKKLPKVAATTAKAAATTAGRAATKATSTGSGTSAKGAAAKPAKAAKQATADRTTASAAKKAPARKAAAKSTATKSPAKKTPATKTAAKTTTKKTTAKKT